MKTRYWLLGIVLLAVVLRVVLAADNVFDSGFLNFSGPDSYYHAWQIQQIVEVFPSVPSAVNFWVYDWLIVFAAWLMGLGTLSMFTIEYIAIFVPPVLAGVTVIFVYLIANRLFNRIAALLTAALLAIMPGEYLSRSLLGTIDHHVFEVFISTLAALLVIYLLTMKRTWKFWTLAGCLVLTLAAFYFSWFGVSQLTSGNVAMSDLIRGSTTEAIPTVVAISPHAMIHVVLAAICGFVLIRWGKGWLRFLVVAWGIVMIVATMYQVRFDYYLIIPTVLMLGYAIDRLFYAQTFSNLGIPRALAVSLAGVVVFITVPTTISMVKDELATPSPAWNETLEWISENTPEDALVTAWWDYGYWIRYRGQRTEYINGGQDVTRIKEIAESFLSEDDNSVPGDYLVIDENTAYNFNRAMMWWLGRSHADPASMDTMAKRLYELQPVEGYRIVYGNEVKVYEVMK